MYYHYTNPAYHYLIRYLGSLINSLTPVLRRDLSLFCQQSRKKENRSCDYKDIGQVEIEIDNAKVIYHSIEAKIVDAGAKSTSQYKNKGELL